MLKSTFTESIPRASPTFVQEMSQLYETNKSSSENFSSCELFIYWPSATNRKLGGKKKKYGKVKKHRYKSVHQFMLEQVEHLNKLTWTKVIYIQLFEAGKRRQWQMLVSFPGFQDFIWNFQILPCILCYFVPFAALES